MTSIRQRLMIVLSGTLVMVWLAVALIVLDRSGHEITELMDAQLAQTARVLNELTLIGNLSASAASPQTLSAVGHIYESKLSFQRWRGDQLIASFGAPSSQALAPTTGFSEQWIGGARWRVFGLSGAAPEEVVFVAQNYTIRQEMIRFLTLNALQPILWSLPLTLILVWWAVSDGLRPLQRVAHAIDRRSAERLEPIDSHGIPMEIRPLTTALNGLMQRLDETLATERRFAADASHELRTPFAIIRMHAQIARRSTDPGQYREALDNLILGVDRATHLISQLLVLARLQDDRNSALRDRDRVFGSLSKVLIRVVAERQAAARQRSISLTLDAPDAEPAVVAVPATVLSVLVGNLIDNAIKYTPLGGHVSGKVDRQHACVRLWITDTGPGIPISDRQRVFDRFYRPAGQSEPGAGLGLAIVRRICARYGVDVELDDGDDGIGLRVLLKFSDATSGSPRAVADLRIS